MKLTKEKYNELEKICQEIRLALDPIFVNPSDIPEKLTDLCYVISRVLGPYLQVIGEISKDKENYNLFFKALTAETLKDLEIGIKGVGFKLEAIKNDE